MSNDVTIKIMPARVVAAYRTSTTHQAVFEDIPAGFGRVFAFLGDAHVEPTSRASSSTMPGGTKIASMSRVARRLS